MGSARDVLFKSAKYLLILGIFDAVLGGLFFLIYGIEATIVALDDTVILEFAFCLIIGGLFDFSQAQTTIEMRKIVFGEKKIKYSASRHAEAQKRGAAIILAGVWVILLALAISWVA